MRETTLSTDCFEQHRSRLSAMAYRMLGSLAEADDAVQETWIRLYRTEVVSEVANLGGWLTTVLCRVCLNMLEARSSRREDLWGVRLPDPIIEPTDGPDLERDALLSDSVNLALLVVLDNLTPAERLAFVLHDLFAIPFSELAAILGRSEGAARKLASRARRQVAGQNLRQSPDADLTTPRAVVDAFLAAARGGDIDALISVLAPDVAVYPDTGRPGEIVRGAGPVAKSAVLFTRLSDHIIPVTVNGTPGVLSLADGRIQSVAAFTVVGGKVSALHILTDPERLGRLRLALTDADPMTQTPTQDGYAHQ